MDATEGPFDNTAMTNDTNLEHPSPEAVGPDQQLRPGGTGDSRPPLRRYDGILGGVATGLAGYFRMAPWLIRLAFVVLSFFGGLGILLYLAGWLLIPAEGSATSIAEHWMGEMGAGRSWIGAILIALAAIWLVTSLDIARSGLAWAIALLIMGVLLYRGEIPDEQRSPEKPAEAEDRPEPAAAPLANTAPATRQPRAQRPPRPRRSRPPSMLGRYTLAAGLIGVGILAVLDNAGVVFPDARHYFALAVAIVGTGLLVGSIWGRSRLLIVVGLILTFMMGIATVGRVVDAFADEVRTFTPSSVDEVATSYNMDNGTLIIDLTSVDWSGEEIDIEADLGAGRLEVLLPDNVSSTINARAGVGQVRVLGRTSEGLGVGRSVRVDGSAGDGDISLDLRVGAGQISVVQERNQ